MDFRVSSLSVCVFAVVADRVAGAGHCCPLRLSAVPCSCRHPLHTHTHTHTHRHPHTPDLCPHPPFALRGGGYGKFRRGFLPHHEGGGRKVAQAPYTVTRRRPPGPTATATCITVPSPITSVHACPAHRLPACVTCKRLRLSAATCCAKGHHAPGYVDRRPLSKVCQANGLPPCPHCTLMQRGVRRQRGHHTA